MQQRRASSGAVALETAQRKYREAMRWRRQVERALSTVGLTYTQWLLLDGGCELIRQTDDAISQNQLSEHTGVDRMTVSQVMRTLEARGLVDRAPAFESPAYRVWITRSGMQAAANGRALLEAACTKASSGSKDT